VNYPWAAPDQWEAPDLMDLMDPLRSAQVSGQVSGQVPLPLPEPEPAVSYKSHHWDLLFYEYRYVGDNKKIAGR
jgi:hypothetical protein